MAETIRGLNDLLIDLEKLSFTERTAVLQTALRKAGRLISADAANRAPDRTGALGRSMSVEVRGATASSAVAKIGPTIFYGRFQERGTKTHRAQPFLEPAFDARLEEAVTIIAEELGKHIDSNWRG